MHIRLGFLIAFVMLCATCASAQVIKNPSAVAFTCPDHALDTSHEVDIIDATTGVIVQTIQGGDPPLNAAGEVVIAITVTALPFGDYTMKVRAVASIDKSIDSLASDVWKRSPAQTGKPAPKP